MFILLSLTNQKTVYFYSFLISYLCFLTRNNLLSLIYQKTAFLYFLNNTPFFIMRCWIFILIIIVLFVILVLLIIIVFNCHYHRFIHLLCFLYHMIINIIISRKTTSYIYFLYLSFLILNIVLLCYIAHLTLILHFLRKIKPVNIIFCLY